MMPTSSDRSRRCPTCGAPNQAAFATFCYDCGEPLDEAAPTAQAAPATRRSVRWEWVIGMVLIAGVLAFALADWWQRETQVQLYQSGVAAAAAHHWDTAASAFAALGTYRDSAKRRQETAQAILIRDSSYIAGNEAAAWQDWISAYRILSQTVAIEADYRNAQALFDTATREAPRQALADTIIRRPDGTRPGLYVHRVGGSEWWLAGSDARSAVWTTAAGPGRILYDAPDATDAPGPAPGDLPLSVIRRLPPSRHLVVADARTPTRTPIRLPDLFGSGGYVMLGPRGVWSLSLNENAPGLDAVVPILGAYLDSLSYYDFQTAAVITNVLSGPPTALLDLNPAQQQLLLARYDTTNAQQPRTRLYRLEGGALDPISDLAGLVLEAQLSPDGTAALYNVSGLNSGTSPLRAGLVWADLTRPDLAPTLVVTQTYNQAPPGAGLLRGRIVPGPTPRVLVEQGADYTQQLRLRDVSSGRDQVLWAARERTALTKYWVSPDGATLWLEERPADDYNNITLTLQPLNPVRPPTHIQMPLTVKTDRPLLLDARVFDGRLVCRLAYIVERPNAALAESFIERVYSYAPVAPTTVPVLLGEQPIEVTDIIQGTAPQFPLLADKLIGTQVPDGFRLRTLDGQALLPPFPGINALWTFQPAQSLLFWGR